jgi:hypothetical protein
MWKDFEKQYNLVHSDIILSDVKGCSPFEDVIIVKCKNCNTSLLAQAFSSHFQACKTIATLPEKVPAKKSISLKRKEKKKLDLDRHCGVALDNGEYCVRSLKCKNHTLNMKRQVSGRSNAFDVLFNDSSKNSSKSAPTMPAISSCPDKEVAGILKSLEGFVPLPLVVYHDPCILELTRRKNELILSEIVKAK